eukprot:1861075-Rhodomonas_salina.1
MHAPRQQPLRNIASRKRAQAQQPDSESQERGTRRKGRCRQGVRKKKMRKGVPDLHRTIQGMLPGGTRPKRSPALAASRLARTESVGGRPSQYRAERRPMVPYARSVLGIA